MSRWDEILSLPVQNPSSLEFSSSDLEWSKIEGCRDKIDRLCLIPFARVNDFVRGESANNDCPTRFHVLARRSGLPSKPKVDSVLDYILYWCSFGPKDHRKRDVFQTSSTTNIPKKKSAGRPNTKRGCTCHFIVKRLLAEPSVALIIYNKDKHVDEEGLPCHGPQDKKAAGTLAMYAPNISEDLRLRVSSLLHVGVSVETIMQRHNESVERQGGPSNRDDLLTHRYVRQLERDIRRSLYELDEDDAVSTSIWVKTHQDQGCVFFFEDFSDSDPFVLGIQTEWQLQQMIRFGNKRLLASESRFGTNKLKYPIHSLVVFNLENKAIPVAWIITPRLTVGDAYRWMRALFNRVHVKDPSWRLAGFVIDDPLVDILAIREVFQCSVLISFWRVRHAWHKNLMKRCSSMEIRAEIAKMLGQTVFNICKGSGNANAFEDMMEDFVDAPDFAEYFKSVWLPRLGVWSSALKSLPFASQETSAAIEFYHNQLKARLMNEDDCNVYQRADWLVDKLSGKVHSYFWFDEYSENDDFARYWNDAWLSGLTTWRKSVKIPDADIAIDGKCAKVINQEDRDSVHVVWNAGSEYALCDCNWSTTGNLCEHIVKTIKFYCNKENVVPSVSMLQYTQALINMLHCSPYDSLVRDHAVSLAVTLQMRLNGQICQDNSGITSISVEEEIIENALQNHDTVLVNENHYATGDVLSALQKHSGTGTDYVVGALVDQIASENGNCGDMAGEAHCSLRTESNPSSLSTNDPKSSC